jgi:hypothetical protein
MGVDCRVFLPARVRIHDVATVIGAALGNEVERLPLGTNTRDGTYARVRNTEVKPSSVAGCAEIHTRDGDAARYFLYHFEGDEDGSRCIMPRAWARNIALCVRLAEFFGGRVDYSDSDDREIDRFVHEQPDISAESGAAWERLQERLAAVQPITEAEVAAYERFASYREAA